ncbi:MAG TPA: LPXTG cell wall anchor domain-containing protein [Acidobacteriota bacterium]|nr:LPXTG cell wall anchor domain-containing protein [Acidobacteriota bacterium]
MDGKDLLVQKQPSMEWASRDIAEIRSVNGGNGEPWIKLTLVDETAKKFADLTRANLHRQLAIVANGKIITAPTINQPIERGPLQMQIAAGANLSESPLLSISWVKDRLTAEKSETASTLKTKTALYVAFGLLLLVGTLYFVFRKKEQPAS